MHRIASCFFDPVKKGRQRNDDITRRKDALLLQTLDLWQTVLVGLTKVQHLSLKLSHLGQRCKVKSKSNDSRTIHPNNRQ